VSRRLGLSIANPQGVLIASAHAGARAIAQALLSQGIAVRVVDTNRENIRVAQLEGIPTFFGNILADDNLDQRFAEGAVVKVTKLSDEFTMSDFSEKYPDALLMFVIDAMGGLNVVATDSIIEPGSSDTVMALVKASDV
jgi:ABC-type sulfate transport system substrate-binding protein